MREPVVYAQPAPPEPVREEHGPAPGPDAFWVHGHWDWNGRQYAWRGGRWDQRHPDETFVQPQWVFEGNHWAFKQTPGGWRFAGGHWRHL